MSAAQSKATKDSPPPSDTAGRAKFELLLTLAKSLQELGLPSHRLEEVMQRMARRFDASLQLFSLPTGLFVTLEGGQTPTTAVVRTRPRGVSLERLSQLSAITRRILRGDLSQFEAKTQIERVMQAPDRWGRSATVVAYVLSAASFAIFFGGAEAEVAIATCLGLAVGLLAILFQGAGAPQRMFELSAALAAAVIDNLAYDFYPSLIEWIPLASGLIILLPGLALVDAVEELAHGHLASGAARLAGVGVVLLTMTFGAVLGMVLIGDTSLGQVPPPEPAKLPLGWWVPAVAAIAVGSTIRFRAKPNHVWVALAASVVALAGSRLGAASLGNLAGPFLAAFVLGVAAQLFARLSGQPAELFTVPGLALLVPGSFGVRSMAALLSEQTTVGVDTAFHMILTSMALVTGLLASSMFRWSRAPGPPDPAGKRPSPGQSNIWTTR